MNREEALAIVKARVELFTDADRRGQLTGDMMYYAPTLAEMPTLAEIMEELHGQQDFSERMSSRQRVL